ncbi:DUF2254 family protein [Rhodococcus tukisamuensis]|uniref:Uncharacterized membrane protein n=1 Tax=Rhodococcus tukisamuensis TaxID=168276 RepID=A0A1G7ACX3_9NOCA|nr:DUF2254 family protein [Rhodococcus tukisamuensis]SDE11716.1 Uncharacterized membrane protein [Rhodococcus tukisamuensis]
MPTPVGQVFRRHRRRLRAGLAQLLSVLAGLGLGLVMPTVTGGPTVPARQVTDLLITFGLGLLGAVAVIFSLLFLVVQWAATTFTPRLTLFRDDPIVWRTFAFALGLAVFAITTALAIGTKTEVSVILPVITFLLLLVMLALLRTLQLRAFAAIQLAPALGSIADRGRTVLATLYPETTGEPVTPPTTLPPLRTTVTWPHPPSVVQEIDVDRLLVAARAANAVIVLRGLPGTTLQRGAPVADVHGADLPDGTVLDTLTCGQERTFVQDPLLALRLLADIALRALSPAVNDPATAVQVLDEIEDLLDRVAAAGTAPLWIVDSAGVPRIVVPLPGFDDFVRTGLDDVIAAAATSPMTLDRLQVLLARELNRSAPVHHRVLGARQDWVDELAGPFTHLHPPPGDSGQSP